jgi:hypothetical protein
MIFCYWGRKLCVLNQYGARNCNIIKTDLSANVNHNKFYSSCQYLLHFSAVLTILRHLNIWEWSVRQKRVAFIDKTNEICCGRRQQYVGFHMNATTVWILQKYFIIQTNKFTTYILVLFYTSKVLLHVSVCLQVVLKLYFAKVTKFLKLSRIQII